MLNIYIIFRETEAFLPAVQKQPLLDRFAVFKTQLGVNTGVSGTRKPECINTACIQTVIQRDICPRSDKGIIPYHFKRISGVKQRIDKNKKQYCREYYKAGHKLA
jgi:hypothetical protein